jgi:hypothetical protein
MEDNFRQRLEVLSAAARRLALVAAAEPVGEPALVWEAAERLSIGAEALAPAADAGLLEVGQRVTFRHPLVRSVAYRAAHAARAAGRAGRAGRRDRPAGGPRPPDEEVCAELERSAGRAQARGGLAAAAAFLERSAALTVDPVRRAGRALAAAQAKYQAGAFDAALELLTAAATGPPDPVRRPAPT